MIFVEFFGITTVARTTIVATINTPTMIAEIIFNDFFLPPVATLNDQISSFIIAKHNTYATVDGIGDI